MAKRKDNDITDLFGDEPQQRPGPASKSKSKRGRINQSGRERGRSKAVEVRDAEFVAAYIEHGNARDAYRALYPKANSQTAKWEGAKMLKRQSVQRELKERLAAAQELATKQAAYNLEAAHDELCERIERATVADQHSAVASLMREKLKLHKLVDSKEPVAQAGLQVIIQPSERGDVQVSSQVIEGETVDGNSTEDNHL